MAKELRKIFETAYREFHQKSYTQLDAIHFVRRFDDPQDQEIIAFYSALIAYGQMKSIHKSIASILDVLGPHPYQRVLQGKLKFPQFTHRFTQGVDLEILSCWLTQAIESYGSLEGVMVRATESLSPPHLTTEHKISAFVRHLKAFPLPPRLQKHAQARQRNLKYLLTDPQDGSACKRINMFLRWVVRPQDGVDLGLWKVMQPSELMLPLDTHLMKVVRHLGWTRSTNPTWKTVEQVSLKLREISKSDPVRYDFALCHLSMHQKDLTQTLGASLE